MKNDRLLPLRMLNEFTYCPRLFHLEWVQSEWADNVYTLDGKRVHKHVDKPRQRRSREGEVPRVLRSLDLSDEVLGLIGKIDLLDAEGTEVAPIEFKRGKLPDAEDGAWEPERVQVAAQVLLLRSNGYAATRGFLWFAGSRRRVEVEVDDDLEARVLELRDAALEVAEQDKAPPPLEDSPKCVGCSLASICLPDEHALLAEGVAQQLHGSVRITTPAMHALMREGVPISYLSHGGWLYGRTRGPSHKNVLLRMAQYRHAMDAELALSIAQRLVRAKIKNSRTFLRRNLEDATEVMAELSKLRDSVARCDSLERLLGIEGQAASVYFRGLAAAIAEGQGGDFDFARRNRRPPRDPVNAMLSFAYAMLTTTWTETLDRVGFDAYLGFYHQPKYGRPALALDLMEEFRPIVADSVVLSAVRRGIVGPDDFTVTKTSCALSQAGRKRFIQAWERRLGEQVTHPVFGYRVSYRQVFEVQARLLGRFLMGEIDAFPEFITR